MEGDDYHFKFKVVILGDKAVGKTSFLDCNTSFTKQSVNPSARLSTPNTQKK
jgi:GTPase SAR1 family protein